MTAEAIEEAVMLDCMACRKHIGMVSREVHEAQADTIRCANCQLDGRASPRWMNDNEDDGSDGTDDEEPEDERPRCICGSTAFVATQTHTATTDTACYDPDDSMLYFTLREDVTIVTCRSCGRSANGFDWDID